MSKHAAFIILTAICGAGIVTWETPANLLLLIVWATLVFIAARRFRFRYLAIVMVIYFAALLAPVKRMDAMLMQAVSLPDTVTTVGQLAEFCDSNCEKLPIRISLPAGGAFANSPVHFSANSVSVRQFIAEIEQQTGCKHYVSGCGNAYTVLYGPAYNFGLSFHPPAGSNLSWD